MPATVYFLILFVLFLVVKVVFLPNFQKNKKTRQNLDTDLQHGFSLKGSQRKAFQASFFKEAQLFFCQKFRHNFLSKHRRRKKRILQKPTSHNLNKSLFWNLLFLRKKEEVLKHMSITVTRLVLLKVFPFKHLEPTSISSREIKRLTDGSRQQASGGQYQCLVKISSQNKSVCRNTIKMHQQKLYQFSIIMTKSSLFHTLIK